MPISPKFFASSYSGCELRRTKTRGRKRAFALEIRFGVAWVGCVYHSADQISSLPLPPSWTFSPGLHGLCGPIERIAVAGRQTRSALALCEPKTSTTIAICLHLLGTWCGSTWPRATTLGAHKYQPKGCRVGRVILSKALPKSDW